MRRVGRGEFAFDVLEVVVGGGDLELPVLGRFPLEPALDGVEVFVVALELGRLVRGEVEVGVIDDKPAGGDERRDSGEDLILEFERCPVEPDPLIPDQARGQERVVEPADPPRVKRLVADRKIVAEERAVEPDRILAEVSALAIRVAHALVRRDRRIRLAGGHAEAAREILAHVEIDSETRPEAELGPVLVGVQLRGELVAGRVERLSGVDGIEIREGPRDVVALRELVAFIPDAQVEIRVRLVHPFGEKDTVGQLAGSAVGGEFEFDLLLNLHLDRLRDVGDPHIVRRGRRVLGLGHRHLVRSGLDSRNLGHGDHVGLRLCAGGFGLRLGLGNHLLRVFLGQNAALHEFVDQIDGDALGRRARLRGRGRWSEVGCRCKNVFRRS